MNKKVREVLVAAWDCYKGAVELAHSEYKNSEAKALGEFLTGGSPDVMSDWRAFENKEREAHFLLLKKADAAYAAFCKIEKTVQAAWTEEPLPEEEEEEEE
jgi:hypothetical protein